MKRLIPCLVAATVVLAAVPAIAQEKPMTPVEKPQRASSDQVPLRVQVVVSRFQGEKKISSMPYTLSVVTDQRRGTNMRMGVRVPVPQTVFKSGEGGMTPPVTSYNYQNVGTNIDCTATIAGPGVFRLDMAVEDTSVFVTEKDQKIASAIADVPAFRTFTSRFDLMLRDGQTAQHTAATDPVSGEVLRVDVTLNVLK